jgi:hypothetical protein
MAGCCECGDELPGSDATELVITCIRYARRYMMIITNELRKMCKESVVVYE